MFGAFGGTAQQQPQAGNATGGNLFGGFGANNQQAGGSAFGGTTQPQTGASSLFGGTQGQTGATGLFGTTQPQTQAGGGLFGSTAG